MRSIASSPLKKDAASVTRPTKQRIFFENVVGHVTSRGEFGIIKRAAKHLSATAQLVVVGLAIITGAPAGATEAKIAAPQGRPVLVVDGKPLPMSGYSPIFWEKPWLEKHLPHFAPLGLGYVFTGAPSMRGTAWFWSDDGKVVTEPVFKIPNSSKLATFDEGATFSLTNLPGTRLIIRFGLDETDAWRKANPDELVLTETGERLNVPSLASDTFWDNSANGATALIRWYEKQPYADKIVAYADFWRGEGTHESTCMGWLSDRSPVMIAAWREYLQKTYGDDAKLQAAWGNPQATITNAVPPADRLRGPVREVAAIPFWQAGKDNAPLRDWLLCLRDLFHRRVRQVAAAMKTGTNGRVPILHDMFKQPMQGWNIGDFFDPKQPMQPFGLELMSGCGSAGVAELFDAPGVDGLITPHDYQGRGLGGIFEPEGAADSCTLRGKLFLCEMDTRSYAGNFKGRESAPARDLVEFEAITWRNIATALSRGWWPYWMDLYADWFSDPAMQPVLGRQVRVLNEATPWPHHDEPGIAIVIDDRATEDTNGAGRYPFLAIAEQIRLGIARCGVPYRIYLLEDLALSNLPPHKVWYFPNLYRCDERRAELVKRVQKDGNVLVWGPGSGISDSTKIGPASAGTLTGFAFEVIPGNYQRRGLFLGGHALTAGIAGLFFGDGLGYGPQLFPTDGVSLASAFAQQAQNHSALAVKEQADWTSIFAAALPLPAGFWRNAARLGKAHVWCESDDVLVASREIVALHSIVPGTKIIRLPRPAKVVDLATGQEVAAKTEEIRFELTAPGTRVFRLLEVRP